MHAGTKTILLTQRGTPLDDAVRELVKLEKFADYNICYISDTLYFAKALSAEKFSCAIVDLDNDGEVADMIRRQVTELPLKYPLLLLGGEPRDVYLGMGHKFGLVDVHSRYVLKTEYFEKTVHSVIKTFALAKQAKSEKSSAAINTKILGLIAHEIRVPLETLRFTQKTLLGLDLDNKARRIVFNSERTVSYMCEYISNFIETARFERCQVTLNEEEFSVCGVVEEVIDLLWPHANVKDIRLVFLPRCNKALTVIGDKKRIRQILINTLSNAIRYTESGVVSCTVYANGRLSFIIRDTGVGMSPERLKTVFHADPDFIISRTSDDHSGGLGIGIALCRKLVALLGGAITVKSKEGMGTIVRFSVPYQRGSSLQKKLEEFERINEVVT